MTQFFNAFTEINNKTVKLNLIKRNSIACNKRLLLQNLNQVSIFLASIDKQLNGVLKIYYG
jgi:hypothetical protein